MAKSRLCHNVIVPSAVAKVSPHVLTAGIPPYAVTAVEDLNVVMIASVSHLS